MSRPLSLCGVELYGDSLVRFVYLDESGISVNESVAVVAGVIVNADLQWKAVEKYLAELIDEYVPPERREGFVFHAKDLFHGTGRTIFDRRTFPLPRAHEALKKILAVPALFSLPVVCGYFNKDLDSKWTPRGHARVNQTIAFSLCAFAAEKYMRDHAQPSELAAMVAENNNDTRKMVKEMHVVMKGQGPHVKNAELYFSQLAKVDPDCLPVRRIVDTVYFAEKGDAILLQIADACAFMLRYFFENKRRDIQGFLDAITGNAQAKLDNTDGQLIGYQGQPFGGFKILL